MGKIHSNKSGNLYMDFSYRNIRCREHTKLKDSPANRKRLISIMKTIEASILLGQFDYQVYFPNSRRVSKFKEIDSMMKATEDSNIPDLTHFSEQWYEDMSVGWRRSYQETVIGIVDKKLKPYFGSRVISDITKADILQFRSSLTKVRRKAGKKLAPSTINRHIKILLMIIAEAADRFDFINKTLGIKPLQIPRHDIKPFTLEEVNKIINNVRIDFRDYFIIRFFTGMRTGEIDGLQWQYVDFEKREILIRRTIVKGREEYTKTDSSQREIKMSSLVYDAFLSQQKRTKGNKFVFCNSAGKPLDYHNVSKRIWYPLLRLLDIEKRNPYQTRHTAATIMLASLEAPEFVSHQLGHSSSEMLFRVYSRFIPNLTRQDGSAFDKLISQSITLEESNIINFRQRGKNND